MRTLLCAFLGILCQLSNGQADTVGKMRYSPEFRFQDGVFLEFSQVQENAPIPKSRILTTIDYNDEQFFDKLLDNKKIYFFDKLGAKHEVETRKIWGFSRNGGLYIRVGNEFNRILVVGSISHFVGNVYSYNQRYYDSYNNGRYFNPYNPQMNTYYSPSTYETKEARQFLLDFATGTVAEYEVKYLEMILMRDPGLHDEYVQLSNKKKKQLKFVYIRKFNERNPLYLPVSNN